MRCNEVYFDDSENVEKPVYVKKRDVLLKRDARKEMEESWGSGCLVFPHRLTSSTYTLHHKASCVRVC